MLRRSRVQQEPKRGVSSFHAWWAGIDVREYVVEASAVLEVVVAPAASRLYFWALQTTFTDAAGHEYGGAHVGLQWNPSHAGSTAVNWGGYGVVRDVTSILAGSHSLIPSTVDDVNTRDFPWVPRVPYRFIVYRKSEGWAADVMDVATRSRTHIRTLHAGGDRLTKMVVWSEVFASCVDPSAVVRWSGLSARTADGRVLHPSSVTLSFPTDGACLNNDTRADAHGLLQVTNTERTGRDGQVVHLPA